MQFDHFLGQVQNRAQLASGGEALRSIAATLQTLGERLEGGEAKDLASQLPRELAAYVSINNIGESERFSLDEFFQRVSIRENTNLSKAVFHTRVVLEILQEAVSPGEIEDVLAQLPNEFRKIFAAGSQGRL